MATEDQTPQRRASDGVRRFALLTDVELNGLAALADDPDIAGDPLRSRLMGELLDEFQRRRESVRSRFTYGVCLDDVLVEPEDDEFSEPAGAIARAEQLRAEHRHTKVAVLIWPIP